MNHHLGSGLSYSSMPSKEWPMVCSDSPGRWPLRVANNSHTSAIRLPRVSTVMYQLQKVVMSDYLLFFRLVPSTCR